MLKGGGEMMQPLRAHIASAEDPSDAVVEESAGPAIAQEQLRRKNIGRSYEKMLLKCGIKIRKKSGGRELSTENAHTLRCQVSASRLHPQKS